MNCRSLLHSFLTGEECHDSIIRYQLRFSQFKQLSMREKNKEREIRFLSPSVVGLHSPPRRTSGIEPISSVEPPRLHTLFRRSVFIDFQLLPELQ
ncbi:hypothetical protein M0R45_006188 [Rubus argutus]|uniref:Maturase K n=1 Tax=Rubus argutus TaxID=59490 RepID=A0AAW1YQ84_RUBAR